MIHPLFKCFGSKWLSSKTLPPPEYNTICEPFAGGAGYSLRHCEKNVVLCETDKLVYHLWSWLINDATQQDILDIPIGIPEGTDIRTVGLEYGQQLLLKNWQRTNNFGNCFTISKWGHLPGQWTANTRARVAEEVQAVKHWEIMPHDGIDMIAANNCRQQNALVTWFIDPPYMGNYQYKMRDPIDYKDLGRKIRGLSGQVIVCEASNPKTGEQPQWLPFKPWKERVTSRRVSGRKSFEMLWTNDQVRDSLAL